MKVVKEALVVKSIKEVPIPQAKGLTETAPNEAGVNNREASSSNPKSTSKYPEDPIKVDPALQPEVDKIMEAVKKALVKKSIKEVSIPTRGKGLIETVPNEARENNSEASSSNPKSKSKYPEDPIKVDPALQPEVDKIMEAVKKALVNKSIKEVPIPTRGKGLTETAPNEAGVNNREASSSNPKSTSKYPEDPIKVDPSLQPEVDKIMEAVKKALVNKSIKEVPIPQGKGLTETTPSTPELIPAPKPEGMEVPPPAATPPGKLPGKLVPASKGR
jgi:hypothetical protein